jgi:rhodanese-related sulfurtransferase
MILETILILFIAIFLPNDSYAFLPPEFFVQGLSALWVVLATGVAVALTPLLIFFKKIKETFKNNKKIIILLLSQTIIVALVLGLFFYFKYYKPLYEDSYLFSQAEGNQLIETVEEDIILDDLDPTIFNRDYVILDGMLRDAEDPNAREGETIISMEQLVMEIEKGTTIYYVDIREPEEYEAGHIVGAVSIRGGDIIGNIRSSVDAVENLRKDLGLSVEEFSNSLIVLYCHDGSRGGLISSSVDVDNIKSMEGGIESISQYDTDKVKYTGGYLSDKTIFGSEYQRKFQILANDAADLIVNGNAFIVEMRNEGFYIDDHVKGSVYLKYNTMSTEEYNQRISLLLENTDKKIIFIAEKYSELFYSNLMILRLKRDYGLSDDNFYILFSQYE